MSKRRSPSATPPAAAPEPLHMAPLIDEAIRRADWLALIGALRDAAVHGSTTAAGLLIAYRFGKPRPADATDPRYVSLIQIMDPDDPDPTQPADAARDGA